jgi:SAM-dependent methyltransferase
VSYKSYSLDSSGAKHVTQWHDRTPQGESEALPGRRLLGVFDRFIPRDPSYFVLEAGCGLGGFVSYFAARGNRVLGIEYEKGIVEQVNQVDPTLPVVQGDVTNLEDIEDASVDAYISLGVIEHFEEGPDTALREAARVLRAGGLAFVTVPYHSWSRRLFAHPLRSAVMRLHRLRGQSTYFWEYRYSQEELQRFLSAAGLETVEVDWDDYVQDERRRHIGLYADYFFLRERGGEQWALNGPGRLVLALTRRLSPWFTAAGVLVVARKGPADGAVA